MREMIPVEEALRIVAAAAGTARPRRERVSLAAALDRVLAEDVVLDHDAPPFDRSAMDGYAVRSADVRPDALPRRLEVVAHVMAGASAGRALAAGEAMAIMTGAPMPEGADLVIPIEWTADLDAARGRETRVRIDRTAAAGANIGRRAEQARAGDVVATAGCRISPALVGALAAAGRSAVDVSVPPHVEIVATGDELVAARPTPGADADPGQQRPRPAGADARGGRAGRLRRSRAATTRRRCAPRSAPRSAPTSCSSRAA